MLSSLRIKKSALMDNVTLINLANIRLTLCFMGGKWVHLCGQGESCYLGQYMVTTPASRAFYHVTYSNM